MNPKRIQPPKDLYIERMVEPDLMQISKIERNSFDSPWSLSLFWGELHNPLARYYVARIDHTVVGYIGILVIQDEGQITTFAVHPDFRRLRIGHTLLQYVLVQSVQWGLDRITLEVRESNEPAQNLYRSFSFEAVGRRKGYYAESGEDAILMNSPDLQNEEYQKTLGLPMHGHGVT